jgi:hypothetical protein
MKSFTDMLAGQYTLFMQRMLSSFLACMFWMVQGDLRLLKLAHWHKGLQTAFVSSSVLLIIYIIKPNNLFNGRYAKALLNALVVMTVDRFIHPSHFGGEFGEAIVTGITAACLTIMIGFIIASVRR